MAASRKSVGAHLALEPAQLEMLRGRLAALERRARVALERAEGELRGEDSEQMRDLGLSGDGGLAEAEFERDIAGAGQARVILAEILAAKARIATGDYGLCADCERPIGFERLGAQPAATRCVACQEKAESAAGARKFR
jgi:DnaK suppressor protein